MALRGIDPVLARRLGMVGLGVVGSAVTLGGMLWLIQRQLKGRSIRVTLVHEMDPATRALIAQYEPSVRTFAERGVDVNMRLWGRRREDEPESATLLTALAPGGSVSGARGYR